MSKSLIFKELVDFLQDALIEEPLNVEDDLESQLTLS
jgi:hypothetical protein